jgi:hypothetical protein
MDQHAPNTRIECVNQTADAIAALLYYFAQPEPLVYSLVDYLLLLSFEESMITIDFRTNQGETRILQTMSEKQLELRGLSHPPPGSLMHPADTGDVPERHQWEDLEEDGITFTITIWPAERLAKSENFLQLVGDRLRTHYPDHYEHVRRLIRQFCEIGPRESADFPNDVPEASLRALTSAPLEQFRTTYWNQVISALNHPDSALNTIGGATGDGLSPPPLNLFALVRYRPDTGYERTVRGVNGASLTVKYAMRLMLADAQIDWLETRTGTPRDEIVRLFSRADGQERYWPADIVFRSGTIYSGVFATPPDGTDEVEIPLDADGEARRRLESDLYAAFGDGARLVYFPIHVGGTPWIALYSLYSPAHNTDWMHFLHLYRQVIPRIAVQLRYFAREAFLLALEKAVQAPVREQVKWSSQLIEQINESWRATSLIFPFPGPQVQAIGADRQGAVDGVEFEIGDTRYEVSFTNAHPYFPFQVDFGQLTDDIKAELTRRIRTEIVARYRRRVLQLHGVLNLAHELKNAILETQWAELRMELEKTPPEELFRGDYPKRLRRGLSHMLWPAALVGLVSKLGKVDLMGDEVETMRRNYLDPLEGFRYEDPQVRNEYRESVRYLAKYLAGLKSPKNPVVIREYAGQKPLARAVCDHPLEELLSPREESSDDILVLNKLLFQPMARGKDETEGTRFAVASLLSEPIRNAVSAILSATGRRVQEPTLIWSVQAEEREVTVSIANTFPRRDEGQADAFLQSTSIELVNALGRMLGIGAVDPPRAFEAPLDGIQLVVTVVHLHPDRLGLKTATLAEND